MKIILLTHERELARKTNTGSLAVNTSGGVVQRILWERVNPDNELLELIESKKALLVYPGGDSVQSNMDEFDNIIVIDGTWQEAQKIYNQSPYLKVAAKTALTTTKRSAYRLRRNQPEGGLCTIECIIEILKRKGFPDLACELEIEFDQFNSSRPGSC